MSGVVSDPSGSAIVGATVTVRATNSINTAMDTATTDGDGQYVITVPAGEYELEITAPLFQSFHRKGLTLVAGSEMHVNAELSLESHAERVMVVEEGFLPDASTTEQGSELKEKKIASVPLNGRDFTDLMSLQPGVIPTSSAQPNAVVMSGVTSTPPSGDLEAGNVSVNGQRETSNGFAVNESDVEEDVNMGTAIVPNLDSIQELQVLTGNFEAQYGTIMEHPILETSDPMFTIRP